MISNMAQKFNCRKASKRLCQTVAEGGKSLGLTIFNHNDLDEDNLKLAVTEVMANRDTHYEENHPLFTEEFGKDLSRNTQWAAFIKKNKIDDAPSFPEVLSFICERMKPVWESLA